MGKETKANCGGVGSRRRPHAPLSFFPTWDIPQWQHQIHQWGPWHFSYLVPSLWWFFFHVWFNHYNIKCLKCKYWDIFYSCEHFLTFSTSSSHSILSGASKYWVLATRWWLRLWPPRQDENRYLQQKLVSTLVWGRSRCRGNWGLGGSSLISLLPWKSMGTTNFRLWFIFHSC